MNDRVSPLALDGPPQFGWLPQDGDGDEVQTGYQIVVSRASTGDTVWDSGRTSSSEQSWVRYGGSALAAGSSYRWTVRTWDRAGAASPYAVSASFDTGLGDGDWSGAQWIRRPATGNDAADEWTLARTVLPVSAGSPVVRARVYVSATGDWALRVNGAQVTRGSSYGYPGEGYYDVADLTTAAKAGQSLAVGVQFHYWKCTCQGRANGPVTAGEGPSGLLAKVVVEHGDGTRQVVVTDGSWRVSRNAAEDVSVVSYRNSDAGDLVERYDATKAIRSWDTAGFNDSGWARATVIGVHPRPKPSSCSSFSGGSSPCTFTHLSAQQAHVSRKLIHPVSVRRLADGTIVADLGKVYAGVPRISFANGAAGRVITVTTSYRRTNTTLTASAAVGARQVSVATAANLRAGDEVVIDAPAAGYGRGAPETRTIASIGSAGATGGTPVVLSSGLSSPHGAGSWVEGSRAGTSRLDTQGSDLRFFYTQKAGAQTAEAFTYWGWRYLQISNPGESLSAGQLGAVVQSTDVPATQAATFASSNPTLDAVFALMQHSALQSAQNVFLDTPTREKGQFLADTINESFATMEGLHERSLTRQAILDFAASQRRYWPNGAMNAVYPNGDAKRDIPDFTEMFPEWVMRYYEQSGDVALIEQVLPSMKKVADYISAAVDSRGLVFQLPGGSGSYQFGIIDWPPPMRYDTVVAGNGDETVVNALAVGALNSVAAAATAVGDATAAQTYGGRARALAAAMNSHLRTASTGRYVDGLSSATGAQISSQSEHAQSYPVAYGVPPASSYAGLGSYLSTLGMRQGPMDLRQLLSALRITGRADAMVPLLTSSTNDGPGKILAEGGTFMWEQWTPGCAIAGCRGAQVNQAGNESFSHGWGAAGSTEILRGLLGLTLTSPGAATIQIAPPAAGLQSAVGTEWTERGPVTVSWTRGGAGLTLDVTVPVNVTATVLLPAPTAGRSYSASGSGRSTAGTPRGGRVAFTVGSGTTHLQVG